MPHKLSQLKLNRVDSCPAGANPGAHIVLAKRKEEVQKATFDEIRDQRDLGKMLNEVSQMTWDLYDAVTSSLWSDGDRAGEVRMSIDQYTTAVDKALASWAKGKPVSKADVDTVREQLIAKFKEALVAKSETKKTENKTPTVEELQAELKKKDDEIAALKAKAEAGEGGEDDDDDPNPDEEVMKSLPESVRNMIEKQNERLAKAEADAKAATEKAQREADARSRTEFIEKAKNEFSNLPGTAEVKGELLKTLHEKLEKKDLDELIKILKSGDAALRSLVMMGERGAESDRGEDGEDTDVNKFDGARGELNDIAKAIRKDNPKLTQAQAFARACNQNQALFTKMRKEQNKARRVVAE